MRPGGGKAKGAGFEREICKRLSLWVTNGEKQDVFWRSAMSGGRATVGGRKGVVLSRQAGDITAVAPEGHTLTDRFFIECKSVNSLDLKPFLFNGRQGRLAKFWAKARQEAARYGKAPMLIVKELRSPTLVVVGWAPDSALPFPWDISFLPRISVGPTLIGGTVLIYQLDHLLKMKYPRRGLR